MELGPQHSWMRLIKRSNTGVSSASEVPQSCGKLIFRKPICCAFAQKLISIDLDQSTKYKLYNYGVQMKKNKNSITHRHKLVLRW